MIRDLDDKIVRTKDISWVFDLIKTLSNEEFTGKVEINFFQGGVCNINKTESLKA